MKTIPYTSMILTMLASSLQSQNINNTLGSKGAFNIGDGSATFLTVSQQDGYLYLNRSINIPSTTGSSLGVIFKGGLRFMHDFQPAGAIGENTFIGVNAGNFSMSGAGSLASYNTGVGYGSLLAISSGFGNSAFGVGSMGSTLAGDNNSAFGYQSLYSNTSGSENEAFGTRALYSNSSGARNSAFGQAALANNTADGNSAFGWYSLTINTTGIQNCAFGYAASYNNTTGSSNSAFGNAALDYNTSGGNNSAFGNQALFSDTSGNANSAFGASALMNTNGSDNSAFGVSSQYHNSSGGNNSSFGYESLFFNASGNGNAAFGDYSLNNATGSDNSGIGALAGSTITSGSNVTCVGYNAQPSSATVSNEITLGNSSITTLRCNTSTISSLSDARDKKNIRDLLVGIDFLMTLKPRLYNWDRRDWYTNGKPDGSRMQTSPTAGFVAQELDQAQTDAHVEWLHLVLKSNPNRLEATPGNLLPVMVKAIQDLKSENDALKHELTTLRASIAQLVKEEVRTALARSDGTKVSSTDPQN